MLEYFMDIQSISQQFDIFYGHLAHFVVMWYIFPRFGMLYQEESGNPAFKRKKMPSHCRTVQDGTIFGAGILPFFRSGKNILFVN
jgi:hypothetical protein